MRPSDRVWINAQSRKATELATFIRDPPWCAVVGPSLADDLQSWAEEASREANKR